MYFTTSSFPLTQFFHPYFFSYQYVVFYLYYAILKNENLKLILNLAVFITPLKKKWFVENNPSLSATLIALVSTDVCNFSSVRNTIIYYF